MPDLPWSWTLPAGTDLEELENGAIVARLPGLPPRVVDSDGSLFVATFRSGLAPPMGAASPADWDARVSRVTGVPIPKQMSDLPWSWTLPGASFTEREGVYEVSAPGRKLMMLNSADGLSPARVNVGTMPDAISATDWDAEVSRMTGVPIPSQTDALPMGPSRESRDEAPITKPETPVAAPLKVGDWWMRSDKYTKGPRPDAPPGLAWVREPEGEWWELMKLDDAMRELRSGNDVWVDPSPWPEPEKETEQ